MDIILKEIKFVIMEILKANNIIAEKIMLFGSRSKKEDKTDSDYDILIIIKNDIERILKYKIKNEINKKAAKIFVSRNSLTGIDLIIRSKKEIEFYKDKIGSVTGEAYMEGVAI